MLTTSGTADSVFIVITFLGRGAISGAWVMAWLLSSELFPTLIRTTASGFGSVCSRVGGAVAPYIAYLFHVHPTIPYFITGALAVLAAVTLLLTVPETSNLPMPEKMPHKAHSLVKCCITPEKTQNGDIASEKV